MIEVTEISVKKTNQELRESRSLLAQAPERSEAHWYFKGVVMGLELALLRMRLMHEDNPEDNDTPEENTDET